MYSREQLVEKLNSENLFVDIDTVSDYIKKYKIDPVYENSQKVEYFDDLALEKLHDLITSDAYGGTSSQFANESENSEKQPDDLAALHEQTAREIEILTSDKTHNKDCYADDEEFNEEETDDISDNAGEIFDSGDVPVEINPGGLSSFKLDVTQQTLTTIARTMAEKITVNMINFLKEGDMAGLAVKLGRCERENQILKIKTTKLVEENKKLRESLASKENELTKFKPFFGGLYTKNK